MKHILVTGAAGFIGSHLVDKLLCSSVRVTAIDSLDNYYSPQLKRHNLIGAGRNENFSFIEVDIRYPTFPSSIGTSKYDGLVHLAAKAGVRPSIEDPNTYQEVNIQECAVGSVSSARARRNCCDCHPVYVPFSWRSE
jgi:UDP-glucuronate 4-epimerase